MCVSASPALNMIRTLIFLSFALVLVLAQDNGKKATGLSKKAPVKKGPDGRPLLFGPKIEECKKRKKIFTLFYHFM